MNQDDDKTYDAPLNLKEVFDVFWSAKKLIISATSVFAIFSVFYALSLQNVYTSTALIKLTDNESNNSVSNMTSQFGGLASLAGVSLPSGGADKSQYVIETLKSRDFLKHLLTFENVAINLLAAKGYNETTGNIIYDEEIYDTKLKRWKKRQGQKNLEPSYIEIHEKVYKNDLKIDQDVQSGFIFIKFEHPSPLYAKHFLTLVIEELNSVVRYIDLKKSTDALNYLENQLLVTREYEIKQSINDLIKTQLRTQMLANISENYLIENISEAYIPEIKSGPFRSIICILITMAGFLISCFYVFCKYLFLDPKKLYPVD